MGSHRIWRQLRLLLWKNFILQIRRPFGTILEIILPVLGVCALVALRELIKPSHKCFRSCTDSDPHYQAGSANVINRSVPIAFYPDTNLTRRLMLTMSCLSTGYKLSYEYPRKYPFYGEPLRVAPFSSRSALEQEASANAAHYLGGVVFENISKSATKLPQTVEYSIRLSPRSSGGQNAKGDSWFTKQQYPRFQQPGIYKYVYYDATFIPIQRMVDQAIIRMQVENGGDCAPKDPGNCPSQELVELVCTLTFSTTHQSCEGLSHVVIKGGKDNETQDTGCRDVRKCQCWRVQAKDNSSNLLYHTADCSCWRTDPQDTVTLTSKSCRTTVKANTTCCGRCVGSKLTKTFFPTVMKNFPYPKYNKDNFILAVSFMFALLMVLTLIYSAGMIVKELVIEKESRLRESMKMMGLSSWIHWVAWFCKQLTFWLVTILLITIILKAGNVFKYSDGLLLFIVILLYFITGIISLFFLSTLFSSARVGMLCGFALWFVSFVPYLSVSANYDNLNVNEKMAVCLLPNSCLGMAMVQYARREQSTEGVKWDNYNEGPTTEDSFSINHVMGMFIIDSIVFIIAAWYIENVFPGRYGVPKPWYFFIQKSYWLGKEADEGMGNLVEEVHDENYRHEDHEDEPKDLRVGVSISGLCKTYRTSSSTKVAVDGLCLNMFSGQITSLLGHNGAGKTTTMSMLVGLFPPTNGDAFISGYSILTDMDKIRESLGLCPQHNVLFDQLTVEEHLQFFITLKTGRRGSEIEDEVTAMIQDLQLVDKRKWRSRDLSGGMKRKLSVAIALAGGSKVVILDEPTAGMDPYARRATWDLLLKHKEGRTMLLTTHFMDEADLLGDRVAIMANGKLVCSGSSLFLKSRFGVGYHMTIVKDGEKCRKGDLTNFILDRVRGSRLVSDAGAELAFVLPREETKIFSTLFSDLENAKGKLGVASFGVSVTTMEEVFMSVGKTAELSVDKKLERRESILERQMSFDNQGRAASTSLNMKAFEEEDLTSDLLTGGELWLQQFKAMFMKRFLSTIRHPQAFVMQVIIPITFTICALLILKLVPVNPADPSLRLDITKLGKTNAYIADFRDGNFTSLPSPFTGTGKAYLKSLEGVTVSEVTGPSMAKKGTSPPNCCYANFFLNDSCVKKAYDGSNFDACDDTFGYKDCMSEKSHCLQKGGTGLNGPDFLRFAGKCDDDATNCPAAPTFTGAKRRSTLFQAYVLDGSNTAEYFKVLASGYTLHSRADDAPDAIQSGANSTNIECYTGYPALCNGTDGEDASGACTRWNVSSSCLTDAYDPERLGMYARVWYSAKAIHTQAYAAALWSNVQLMSVLETEGRKGTDYKILTNNYPLPKSLNEQVDSVKSSGSGLSFGIIVTLGMAFLTASFSFVPVEEKASKSKHIQFVSGVHSSTYWFANWTWDMINFLLPLIVILITFAAFNISAYSGDNFSVVFLLLLFFGWSGLPLSYCLSFLFSSPLFAYGIIAVLVFFVGLAFVITLFALNVSSGYESAEEVCRYIFYLLPHFCLAQGLSDIFNNEEKKIICDKIPADLSQSQGKFTISRELCYKFQKIRTNMLDWEEPGVGKEVMYMAITGVVYFVLTLLIEKRFFVDKLFSESSSKRPANCQQTDTEDDDVKRERQRVDTIVSETDEDVVVLKNLTKVYNSKLGRPAADNLCLGIPSGECFGLLGVNGAGKTTTFNMLTGDTPATYGTAYLKGYNIRTQLHEVQQRIGYCPQFDALLERLTAKELLTMYARLRGIPSARIPRLVEEAVKQLNLEKWADRLCGTYSGGNKRKLSTAVALVGDPPIVFLDEPTTGMDPGARRFLWNVLTAVMRGGRSIVLTSHSMEECEALCTRLAIMVNGQFKCLGSIQHLKNKFGTGYMLMVKVQPSNDPHGGNMQKVMQFVEQSFTGADLLESHNGQLQYQLRNNELTWSYIFGQLEHHRESLGIIDYSVSQTSLEQVFLNFARQQF